jgi:hypothetical protein
MCHALGLAEASVWCRVVWSVNDSILSVISTGVASCWWRYLSCTLTDTAAGHDTWDKDS